MRLAKPFCRTALASRRAFLHLFFLTLFATFLSQYLRNREMTPSKSLRSSGATLSPSATGPTVMSSAFHKNPHIPSTFIDNLPLPKLLVFDLDYTLWPFWCDTHITPPLKLSSNKNSKSNPSTDPTSYTPNKMLDRYNESFSFYFEVPYILSAAKQRGIPLGIASRTHTPDLARDLLRGLTIPVYPSSLTSSNMSPKETPITTTRAIDLFPSPLQQIYPGSKTTHFKQLGEVTRNPKQVGSIPELNQVIVGDAAPANGNGGGKKTEGIAYEDMIFFDDEARNRNVEMELGVCFVLVRDGITVEEVDRGIWEWRRRKGIHKLEGGDGNGNRDEVSELEG